MLNTIKIIEDVDLPEFHRQLWVSEEAKQNWEPKFEELYEQKAHFLAARIILGMAKVAILKSKPSRIFSAKQTLIRHNLYFKAIEEFQIHGLLLPETNCRFLSSIDSEYHIVAKSKQDISAFEMALMHGDEKTIKEFLGIPMDTISILDDAVVGCLFQLYKSQIKTVGNKHYIPIHNSTESHFAKMILLNYLGLDLIWYTMTESQHQKKAQQQVNSILEFFKEHAKDAYETLSEMLSWNLEVSSYHGISEVKTPVFKFIKNTDALSEKLIFRFHGESKHVELGAKGLRFPYRTRFATTEIAN